MNNKLPNLQNNKANLFVYGSLMSGISSPIATYLKSNSVFLGEAVVEGILYDLGQYPGIIPQTGCNKWVKGHVFELSDAAKMLPVLDKYEGSGATFTQPTEYVRKQIQVLVNKQSVSCWVYQYNYSTDDLKVIASGDYLAYLEENKDFQQFVNSQVDFNRH